MAFISSHANASNGGSSSNAANSTTATHTQNLDDFHACIKEIERETVGRHVTVAGMKQMAIKRMAEKRMMAKKEEDEKKNDLKKSSEDTLNDGTGNATNGNTRMSLNINEHFKRGTAQLKNILNIDDNDDNNYDYNAPTNNATTTTPSHFQQHQQQGRGSNKFVSGAGGLLQQLGGGNRQRQSTQLQQLQQSQQQPCIMRRGSDADPMNRIDPAQLKMLRELAASFSSLDTSLGEFDTNKDGDDDDDHSHSTSSSLLSAAIDEAFRRKSGISLLSIKEALEDIVAEQEEAQQQQQAVAEGPHCHDVIEQLTDFPNVDLSASGAVQGQQSPPLVPPPPSSSSSPNSISNNKPTTTTSSKSQSRPHRPVKKRFSLTKQCEKSINLSDIHELQELDAEELSVSLHVSGHNLAYDGCASNAGSLSDSYSDYNEGSLICKWQHQSSDSPSESSFNEVKRAAGQLDTTEENKEERKDNNKCNEVMIPDEVGFSNNSNDDNSESSWKEGNASASTLICKFGQRPGRRVSDISMGDIQEAAQFFEE